jgi:hypothetical protein
MKTDTKAYRFLRLRAYVRYERSNLRETKATTIRYSLQALGFFILALCTYALIPYMSGPPSTWLLSVILFSFAGLISLALGLGMLRLVFRHKRNLDKILPKLVAQRLMGDAPP